MHTHVSTSPLEQSFDKEIKISPKHSLTGLQEKLLQEPEYDGRRDDDKIFSPMKLHGYRRKS